MDGIGILINVLAAVVGGGFGVIIQGRTKVKYQQIISQAVGLLVMGVGLYQCVGTYFVISDKKVEMTGMLLVAFSLLCGGVIGWAVDVEKRLYRWSERFNKSTGKEAFKKEELRRKKLQASVDKAVSEGKTAPKVPLLDRSAIYEMPSTRSGQLLGDGFVAATLILCTNPMLLSGIYADCVDHAMTQILIKAAIDIVLCFLLAFVYGSGVLYAVIPMGALGGCMALLFSALATFSEGKLASFMKELLIPEFMGQLTLIGGVMLVGVGVCLAFEKKFKTANLLPAALIPVIYKIIMALALKSAEK